MNRPAAGLEVPIIRRRCYLVRHGHVDYFTQDGRPLDPRTVSLSARGIKQVESLAAVMDGLRVDRVVCSDYPRAIQTANAVIAGRSITIEVRPGLREVRAGRLRDLNPNEFQERFCYALQGISDDEDSFLGGERWGDFRTRVMAEFEALLKDPSWSRLLIVSHDAVNRTLLGWVLGSSAISGANLEQDNACLNIVDLDMQGESVRRRFARLVNFTPYDTGKEEDSKTVMERIYAQMITC